MRMNIGTFHWLQYIDSACPVPAPLVLISTYFFFFFSSPDDHISQAQPILFNCLFCWLSIWLRAVGKMVCQAGDTNYFSFLVNGLRYLSTLWLGRNYLLGASVHRDLPLFHLRDQFYDLYFLEQKCQEWLMLTLKSIQHSH